MTTLHISHNVRDFDRWLAAFNGFHSFRAEGGVTTCSVRRGVDDPTFVAVDLGFTSTDAARAFLGRLEAEIWSGSAHLEGPPACSVLAEVG